MKKKYVISGEIFADSEKEAREAIKNKNRFLDFKEEKPTQFIEMNETNTIGRINVENWELLKQKNEAVLVGKLNFNLLQEFIEVVKKNSTSEQLYCGLNVEVHIGKDDKLIPVMCNGVVLAPVH